MNNQQQSQFPGLRPRPWLGGMNDVQGCAIGCLIMFAVMALGFLFLFSLILGAH